MSELNFHYALLCTLCPSYPRKPQNQNQEYVFGHLYLPSPGCTPCQNLAQSGTVCRVSSSIQVEVLSSIFPTMGGGVRSCHRVSLQKTPVTLCWTGILAHNDGVCQAEPLAAWSCGGVFFIVQPDLTNVGGTLSKGPGASPGSCVGGWVARVPGRDIVCVHKI